jgi:tRNA modification GTPase
MDTAGLRHSDDEVEKIGIERAWGHIETADCRISPAADIAVLFLHDLRSLHAGGDVVGQERIDGNLFQLLHRQVNGHRPPAAAG